MKKTGKKLKLTPGKIIWLVVAVLVVCCILLSFSETPLGWQADLTPGKIYTLSPQTEELLEDLKDDVTIYTLYSLGNSSKVMATLLEQYKVTCEKITVANIDPTTDRPALKQFEGLKEEINDGSLVIADEQTGRYRVVDVSELYQESGDETYFFAENSITSAIHYVTTGEFQRIYCTTGHRETNIENLSSLIGRYKLRNYLIEEYDYLRTAGTPDPQTDILMCISPKEDLSESEAEEIREYIRQGGTFILLYDNAVYNETRGTIELRENEMPILNELLRRGGILLREGLIAGENAAETGFRNTSIELEPMADGRQIVFSECAALGTIGTDESTVTTILQTRPGCILKDANGATAADGPFSVGMISDMEKGRMAVFSTSSFVGDTEYHIADNAALLDGILNEALPGEPEMILPAKRANTDELFINSILVKAVITVAVLLVIPGAILGIGVYVTKKRREKYI